METKQVYKVDTTGSTIDEVVRACECQSIKGHFVSHDGRVCIKLHGSELILEVAHGWCTRCGRPFHHTPSDVTMEKILTRKIGKAKAQEVVRTGLIVDKSDKIV